MNNGELSKYADWKDKMRTGDLLQWRENCWYFWLWRLITRSKVNHSSMVLRLREYKEERKRFTTESRLLGGTVLNRLSHRLEHYDGEVYWYPLKDEWDPYREKIGEQMLERIGIPFDVASGLRITLRRLLGARCRKVGDRIGLKAIVSWINRHEQNEVFCSEYCYWVYEESTRTLQNKPEMNKLSELPLPDDMENLGIFEKGERIL